ncbi:MAG: protein translocase subunit SecF [Patescibacteria group bacterium]|nr:protein translocase subunit SecF [Patescibacteria group bacterium]
MKKPFSFIKNRIYFYIFSAILFIAAILSIIFYGFNLGIDFAGGSVLSVRYEKNVSKNSIEQSINNAGFSYYTVQPSQGDYFVRTKALDSEQRKDLEDALKKVGQYQELSFETVGPSVSADLRQKALWGVLLVSLGIILYIAYAFRSIPKGYSSFVFGLAAVIALLHDAVITAGVFSFLGHFYANIVVDAYFITALLTTGGYSVHDTIVVADRLRENLLKSEGSLANLADLSLWQVLTRSVSTSVTTLFVSLSLYLLGGESIRNFALALVVGVAMGTFSSIFVAVPIIVDWYKHKK